MLQLTRSFMGDAPRLSTVMVLICNDDAINSASAFKSSAEGGSCTEQTTWGVLDGRELAALAHSAST